MRVNGQTQTPEQQLRAMPLVVGAMLLGVLVFACVATFLQLTGGGSGGAGPQSSGQPDPTTLLAVMGVLLLPTVAGYFVVGAVARAQARRVWDQREDDEGGRAALVGTLMTTTVVRAALAEGFGLFAAVLILIQGSMIAWGAVVLCVVLQAALLPVRSRLEALEEAATGMRAVRRFGEGV